MRNRLADWLGDPCTSVRLIGGVRGAAVLRSPRVWNLRRRRSARGATTRAGRRPRLHDGLDDTPRAERPWDAARAGHRTGRAAAEHHRRRGRTPAVFERRRQRSGRSRTASSTTMPRFGETSPPRATPLPAGATQRSCRTSTSGAVQASPSTSSENSRSPSGTASGAARCSHVTALASSRCTTRSKTTSSSSGPSSRQSSRVGWSATELDYDAIDVISDASATTPGPATPLRSVRKLLPGHRLVVERGRRRHRALLELPGAPADRASPKRSGVRRRRARLARARGSKAPDERRACSARCSAVASTRRSSSR